MALVRVPEVGQCARLDRCERLSVELGVVALVSSRHGYAFAVRVVELLDHRVEGDLLGPAERVPHCDAHRAGERDVRLRGLPRRPRGCLRACRGQEHEGRENRCPHQLLSLDEVFWRYMTKQQIVTSRRGSTSLQKSGGFPRRSANVSRLDRALLVVFEGRVRPGRCRGEGVFGFGLLGRDLRLHLGDRVADLLITADAWTGDAPRDEIEGLFALGPPGPVVLQRLVVGGRSAERHVTGRRSPSRGLFAVAKPLQEFPGRKLLFGSRLG